MTRCPVCQTPLQGPNRFCPTCSISRPVPAEEPRAATPPPPSGPRNASGPSSKIPPLALCVALDAVGMLSYALPLYGEAGDALWAPISGVLFFLLFRRAPGVNGTLGAILATVEEVLPITDVIPTFTLAWIASYRAQRRAAKG